MGSGRVGGRGAFIFATLKRELLVGEKILSQSQLREMISDYIDRYDNPVRTRSTLDRNSPIEYEKQVGRARM